MTIDRQRPSRRRSGSGPSARRHQGRHPLGGLLALLIFLLAGAGAGSTQAAPTAPARGVTVLQVADAADAATTAMTTPQQAAVGRRDLPVRSLALAPRPSDLIYAVHHSQRLLAAASRQHLTHSRVQDRPLLLGLALVVLLATLAGTRSAAGAALIGGRARYGADVTPARAPPPLI